MELVCPNGGTGNAIICDDSYGAISSGREVPVPLYSLRGEMDAEVDGGLTRQWLLQRGLVNDRAE